MLLYVWYVPTCCCCWVLYCIAFCFVSFCFVCRAGPKVRRRGCDRKFKATRLAVGEECDLAILTVEDEDFWKGASPLAFGELPELTDDVSVIG